MVSAFRIWLIAVERPASVKGRGEFLPESERCLTGEDLTAARQAVSVALLMGSASEDLDEVRVLLPPHSDLLA